MMTWKGRYFDKNKPFVFGGKLMLSTVMCVAIMVLGVEWGGKLRIIPRAVA